MESLKAKLQLLALSEEENEKAESKFLATLALVSYDELNELVNYLKTESVNITRARDIKVLANEVQDVKKKFSILADIHETDIYRQSPDRINLNVLDIFKKIKYCIQTGRAYKKEDGSYEPFLFSESEWQKVFNRDSNSVEMTPLNNEEVITVTPVTNEMENRDTRKFEESVNRTVNNAYRAKPAEEEKANPVIDNIDNGPFDKIRKELEGLQGQLAELDSLKNVSDDEISFNDLDGFNNIGSFNDIEPETYSRRAA